MPPGPETEFSNLVQKSLGATWPSISIWKYHGDQYGIRGFPDIFGHLNGHFFLFELKVLPGRPTPEQVQFLLTEGRKGMLAGLLVKTDRFTESYFYIDSQFLGSGYTTKDRNGWLGLSTVNTPHGNLIDFRPLHLQLTTRRK